MTAARSVGAMPTISNAMPANQTVVQSPMKVSANVSSPFVITSVSVTVGSTSHTLGINNPFATNLDISAVPIGMNAFTISATDANGETATFSGTIDHEELPVLTIGTPDATMALPSLRLLAHCAPTGPFTCASIAVTCAACNSTNVATVAGPTLDQTVSFPGTESALATLTFTATNTAGLQTHAAVTAYVGSDARVVLVDQLAGPVLDIDATRILYSDATGVHIKARATGTITDLGGNPATNGHLSTTGAAWSDGDWIAGVSRTRTNLRLGQARGDFALLYSSLPANVTQIWREDLTTGAVTQIAATGGSGSSTRWPQGVGIRADGTAVYSFAFLMLPVAHEVHAVGIDGTDTLVGDGCDYSFDGDHSIGVSTIPTHPSVELCTLHPAGFKGSDIANLGTTADTSQPMLAAGQWVAFTKVVSGHVTAWTRAPDGTVALASALNNVTSLAALNPDGQLVYDAPGPLVNGVPSSIRYLGSAGAAFPTKAAPIGGWKGVMQWVGTDWYEIFGSNVFLVTSGAMLDGDAGTDAGVADSAGSDAAAAHGGGSGPDADGSTTGTSENGVAISDSSAIQPAVSSGGCTVSGSNDPGSASPWLLLVPLILRRRRERSACASRNYPLGVRALAVVLVCCGVIGCSGGLIRAESAPDGGEDILPGAIPDGAATSTTCAQPDAASGIEPVTDASADARSDDDADTFHEVDASTEPSHRGGHHIPLPLARHPGLMRIRCCDVHIAPGGRHRDIRQVHKFRECCERLAHAGRRRERGHVAWIGRTQGREVQLYGGPVWQCGGSGPVQ